MPASILINIILDYYKTYKCYLFNRQMNENIVSNDTGQGSVSIIYTIKLKKNKIIISHADWQEYKFIYFYNTTWSCKTFTDDTD